MTTDKSRADALTEQDIYDKFSFLEGLVSESIYVQIADTAIEIARATSAHETGAEGADLERALSQTIDERDGMEEVGTRLANAVGEYLGVDVGEWSSANSPILAAIEALESRSPAMAAAAPEGCTPADARMLREANHALAAENDALRRALRPFARVVSTDKLSWAMVEYCVEGDPEKQTFQRPQMQRAFNRAADMLRTESMKPAAATADERAEWDSTRHALAIAMVGFAGRTGSRDLDSAAQCLDALTEPGSPLTWLREARAAASPVAETRAIGEIRIPDDGHPYAVLLTAYDEHGSGWKAGTKIYAAPQPAQADAPMQLTAGMDRAQFHDKAWALWHEKALGDAKLPKLSIYAIRTLWDVLFDSMPAQADAPAEAREPAKIDTKARMDWADEILRKLPPLDPTYSIISILDDHDPEDRDELLHSIRAFADMRATQALFTLYAAPPAARVASLTDEQRETIRYAAVIAGEHGYLETAKKLRALLNGADHEQ
ncbi:hypothetical protein LGM75_23980 [Burkholderia multivorans]|uniref:hypothetical protein n=1 Tax=Burkholderia multivorans TaxID=87883 RepID=UPI001C228E19|nr:hypothetical protein [Burkholderia multivorans]MBU9468337.1 hypothetical protein [Burkholderia multivorans]MCA8129415.1 hypothetical protein [Burkholderia multivorans]